jgi:DHA1 family multidrug resistance protein-like MFS transporter
VVSRDVDPERWVLPLTLFFSSFAWSFVYVSMPFYVTSISTLDEAATLRWTGWILGITPLVNVLTNPVWGRWATSGNAKRFYVAVEVGQGLVFLLTALARTLPELLLARFLLGFMGAASTFALVIASRSGGDVRRRVSLIQSGITVGQVVGPLAGAVAAHRFGFRPSFAMGGMTLLGCGILVARGIRVRPGASAGARAARPASLREIVGACMFGLAGSMQIFFLAAILPQVLPGLGVAPGETLQIGGVVLFASGVAAAIGSLAAPRIAEVVGERRAVAGLMTASCALVALLGAAPGVWTFGAVRFLQVLCVAPVFPLTMAGIAQRASGQAIGVVNSSRIAAGFAGPVLATMVLAAARPFATYAVIAACGLATVAIPLSRHAMRWRRRA